MAFTTIDLQTWRRKHHYEMFRQFESPHYNICADVDITQLYQLAKAQQVSSFALVLYCICRTANALQAFRLRMREDEVVLHDAVHPSFTVLGAENTFSYCTHDYQPALADFLQRNQLEMQQALASPSLASEGRDDLIYLSCIPWVKFTSISHAMPLMPTDSVPRFSWGKYQKQNNSVTMPLSVQVHHALVDGYDVGQFFQKIERLFAGIGDVY